MVVDLLGEVMVVTTEVVDLEEEVEIRQDMAMIVEEEVMVIEDLHSTVEEEDMETIAEEEDTAVEADSIVVGHQWDTLTMIEDHRNSMVVVVTEEEVEVEAMAMIEEEAGNLVVIVAGEAGTVAINREALLLPWHGNEAVVKVAQEEEEEEVAGIMVIEREGDHAVAVQTEGAEGDTDEIIGIIKHVIESSFFQSRWLVFHFI